MPPKIQNIINYLQKDIWRVRVRKLPRHRSIWIRQLRTLLLALRGFNEDKCQLRAAALTFYSLLSIVPLMAMAFAIAKGFGFEKYLERQLYDKMSGQEEVITKIVSFSQAMLENTRAGVIAGIGIAVLFWTVIKVLGNIENSFNDIWGIKKPRSISRKFSDYLSFMLIGPILFIIASSANVMIVGQIKMIMMKLEFLGPVVPLILNLLKLLPFIVVWVLFTFVYLFMPNTKVNFRSALIAGIMAGTIYQFVQWAYITFQIGASKFGAIYGSFAALPLFLVWLQMSWIIVLFGAEISFAGQNVDTYEFEPDCLSVSRNFKNLMTLWAASHIIRDFHEGRDPRTTEELSHDLEIPIRLLRQILFELGEADVLREVKVGDQKVEAYQPARDIQSLSALSVLKALDEKGIDNMPVMSDTVLDKLTQTLSDFKKTLAKSPSNVLLKDI